MHYLIDGYNLLFRTLHDNRDLQGRREAIIHDLNLKISWVKLNVSIVFDATFQIGGRERFHYDQLEIFYTAEGETADEYILEEIKHHPHPQQVTVITSDKDLAWRARNRTAHTETVEEFTFWLNRAYKNKLKQMNKEKRTASSRTLSFPPKPKTLSPSLIPSKGSPLESYSDYYSQVFEIKWQEILVKEEALKKQKEDAPLPKTKCPPRRTKKAQDPFKVSQSPEEKAATESERWLKIFEGRVSET